MHVLAAIGAGLILGSFLSVLIDRWPRWKGVMMGRSHCPHCQHVLAWYDLVPLASWASLAGKCRYCGVRISVWYPVYEISMAGGLGLYALQSDATIIGGAMLAGFIMLFFFDLRRTVLPDVIVVSMGALALIAQPSLMSVLSAAILGTFFGALYMISRGKWLGLGDVKMALVVGLWFADRALPITLAAVWAGALVGVMLIVLGKATRKTALPFGAFWAAACIMAIITPHSLDWITHLFLWQ